MKITLPSEEVHIVGTRFNNKTYLENLNFRNRTKWEGCVYGTPKVMPVKIPTETRVLVLEMNNEENKLEGIGVIENIPIFRRFKIYSDDNYNRLIYKSKKRIDKSLLLKSIEDEKLRESYENLFEKLELICFKGKGHIKRGNGFTKLPQKRYMEVMTKPDTKLLMKICGLL